MRSRNHGFARMNPNAILVCEDSRQGTTLVVPQLLLFSSNPVETLVPEGSALLIRGGAHATV